MSVSSPEGVEYDLKIFQKDVRTADSFYGDLNIAIVEASSPVELVQQLQKARMVLDLDLASHLSEARRERLINRKKRITEFISQIRHQFNLQL